MCGIAGIIADHGLTPHEPAVMDRMLTRLAHRGPDGRAVTRTDHAILGHTRLAIIDPQTGRQPIANERGTTFLVANGEIYNHRELRRQLESRGHTFRTRSDCETILHLYEDHGPDCVNHLRGMFAFAILDTERRRLLLARDPLGIKPLYYARTREHWLFASQLDALMAHPSIQREVDLEALHEYLTFHYVPSPRTILKDVHKLPPATIADITDDRIRLTRYWNVDFTPDDARADHEWTSEARERLTDAVRSHLDSDVPVGAFLSGGLDSSSVVHTMAGLQHEPLLTHTVGFHHSRFDERDDAHRLAAQLGADHLDQIVTPDPHDMTSLVARAFDEPFADPSAIPTFYASRLARKRVKTLLSGDGGDETLAGYTRYVQMHRQASIRRHIAHPPLNRFLRAGFRSIPRRMRALSDNLTADTDRAHYLNVAWYHPYDTLRLLNDDTATSIVDHDPFDVIRNALVDTTTADPVSRCQHADIRTWLADGVLCKVDRAAMSNSLEVRVPLLDTEWVAFAARLPNRLKITGNRGKHLLRTMMRSALGDAVTDRRKKGFEVPLHDWFRGPLNDLTSDLLLRPDARIHTWLERCEVQALYENHKRRRSNNGPRLWSLLMLELWAQQHLQPPTTSVDTHEMMTTP